MITEEMMKGLIDLQMISNFSLILMHTPKKKIKTLKTEYEFIKSSLSTQKSRDYLDIVWGVYSE